MKKYILLLSILFIVFDVFPQEDPGQQVMTDKEQRQLAREYKEAQRKAEADRALKATELMIGQHRFVLEADYISGRSGTRYPVNSTLNFIIVDSSEVVMQIGSVSGLGYNGVGGFTVRGSVTKYELNKKIGKKHTSYSISMYIMSNMGMYDIVIWVTGSGSADATVRGSTPGVLNYSGRLIPLNESRVYKGTSF